MKKWIIFGVICLSALWLLQKSTKVEEVQQKTVNLEIPKELPALKQNSLPLEKPAWQSGPSQKYEEVDQGFEKVSELDRELEGPAGD